MKILDYLKGVKTEFGLVKWPTKKAAWYFTLAVLVIALFFSIWIGLFDVFFANLLDAVINIRNGHGIVDSVRAAFSGEVLSGVREGAKVLDVDSLLNTGNIETTVEKVIGTTETITEKATEAVEAMTSTENSN